MRPRSRFRPTFMLPLLLASCTPGMTTAPAVQAPTPVPPGWVSSLFFLNEAQKRAACEQGYAAAQAGSQTRAPQVVRFTTTDGEATLVTAYGTVYATCLARAKSGQAFPDVVSGEGPSLRFAGQTVTDTSRLIAGLIYLDAAGQELDRDVLFTGSNNFRFTTYERDTSSVGVTLTSAKLPLARQQVIARSAALQLFVNFGRGLVTFPVTQAGQPGLQ